VALEHAGLGVPLQVGQAIRVLADALLDGGEALGAFQFRDPQPKMSSAMLSCFYDQ
jgi:hypothetical protein